MNAKDSDERVEQELSAEQRQTLELLNGHMPELLRDFDEVLARYGIKRQIHRFTTTKERDKDGGCQMVCCICPPPDEACMGGCSPCPKPPVAEVAS